MLFSATLAGSAIDGAFGSDGSVVIAHADDRVFSFAPGTFVQRDFAVWRDVRVSLNALALLGDRALVGMRDEGRVALVDLAAGRTLRVLDLHEGGVVAIVAVPARDVFVTAGRDGRMRIVSRDGVAQEPVLLHESGIDRIAVDPAGRRLWALGFNDTIVDVAIDDPDAEGLDPMPVGRDGRDLVVHPDGSVLVGAIDGTLLRHGPDRRLVPIANVGRIVRLALDPSGRRLAVRADDGEVTLWALDLVDGVKGAYPLAFLMPGGVGGLGALSIDPSGTRLLTSTRDGDVRVWRIDDDSLQQRKDPKAPWNDVAISRDGRRVGEVIDGGIIVRDTASGDLVGYVGIDERIKAFALDRTGHKVLIGAGQRVIIHDLDGGDALSFVLDGGLRVGAFLDDGGAVIANGATIARLPPGSATPVATHALNELAVVLATNPDDTQVIVGGARGGAVLFDARDLSEVRRFSVADGASVTGVAFSTDGARLALATSTVLEVRTIADGSLVRRMPGERIVGVCTGFLPDGRVVDLRINAVVVANPDDGTSTVRFNVPATGSCQMTETGLMAMRLGDYIQPYDLVLDAPLWFSRGVVDGRISTQRGGPVWPPREFVAVTQVDAGPSHLCSAESGGAFVMRSADGGRVLARAVDPTSWPVVVASRNGCVWQQGDTLVRLRPSNDGGVVEVVAREVAAFGGGDGVVIAIGGGRLRIVDDQGGPERPLPTGGLVIDGGGAIGVSAGEVVHALPSGEIARWRLGHDEAPRIVRAATGDVMAVLPLPGGLIAAGTSGERVFVVDEDNGSIVIDESVRGAVQVLTIRREASDGGEQITLQAGTNLGNVQRLDLTPLLTPRCAMLRAVWAAAPVAWERGHPVPRPMPTDHPCATR